MTGVLWRALFLVVGLFGATLHPVHAQEPIQAALTGPSDPILIGEPFPFRLEVRMATGARLMEFPLQPQWGPYEVVDAGRWELADDGTVARYSRLLIVRIWETGTVATPPLELRIQLAGDETPGSWTVPPIQVKVHSVLDAGDLNLRPLKSPFDMFYIAPAQVALMLGVAASSAVLMYSVILRVQKRLHSSATRAPNPAAFALAELNRLRKRLDDDPASAYARVAEVVRTYIQERLKVRTTDLTTSELMQTLESGSNLPRERRHELRTLLELADLVKFARIQPSDPGRAADAARAWVQRVEREQERAAR